MATCGKCHATNVDVQHVRNCYLASSEHRDDYAREVLTGEKSSTELASRTPGFRVGKPQGVSVTPGPIAGEDRVYLFVPFEDKDTAKGKFGARWDGDKRQWYVKKSADFDEMPKHWFDEPVEYVAEDGIYKVDNGDGTWDIYKVATAQYHDATGYKFARKLALKPRTEEELNPKHPKHTHKGRFVKAKGMQFRLKPEQLLPHDEAVKFGQVYGFCVRCGAILTDEDSIERGMGPDCASK